MKTLLLSLFLLLPCSLHAALNGYLELTVGGNTIVGDATITTMGGTDVSEMLEVVAFRHELIRTSSQALTHKGFTLVKRLDKSTPLLAQALANNATGEAVLHLFRRNSDTGEIEEYLTYTLQNCQFVRVQPWKPNTLDPDTAASPDLEEITLSYQSITIESSSGNTVSISR
ncbi:type VI secretion system tube protein TssD [Luteolibacter marinus]|uniref:type VI secretion system tube protein TssD n=1 Tax=Luteolibacter marinus TaxID=2776705 RepID=UPI001865EFD8|nr:type VI secretion system tube protein TssD [Luteolibacter marinus]